MKIKVGVFFGGESVEHEVSIISANQAMHAIDKDIYEVVPIYITKDHRWYTGDILLDVANYKNIDELLKKAQRINMNVQDGKIVLDPYPFKMFGKTINSIDIAFPVIHGTNGEDGSLQGFFELYGIPYVGCDVKSAAVGQDKVFMKNILRDSKLPVVNFTWFYASEYRNDEEKLFDRLEQEIGLPLIIKPASLGSSVGIAVIRSRSEFKEKIEDALRYDPKIIVEEYIKSFKEVNISVIGDYETAYTSVVEEVAGSDEILSYQEKYLQGGKGSKGAGMASISTRIIPANITDEQKNQIEDYAKKCFNVLGSSGVCRIDFFIDNNNGSIYIIEINTIPGSLSFYLWEPAGKNFTQMTTDLLKLAIKRQREREKLIFSYKTNILQNYSGGTKGKKI